MAIEQSNSDATPYGGIGVNPQLCCKFRALNKRDRVLGMKQAAGQYARE